MTLDFSGVQLLLLSFYIFQRVKTKGPEEAPSTVTRSPKNSFVEKM